MLVKCDITRPAAAAANNARRARVELFRISCWEKCLIDWTLSYAKVYKQEPEWTWKPKCLQKWQFCMAKVRHHRFRAGKPLNVTKVGVAKHKVGGAAASPTVGRYRKLHPWRRVEGYSDPSANRTTGFSDKLFDAGEWGMTFNWISQSNYSALKLRHWSCRFCEIIF